MTCGDALQLLKRRLTARRTASSERTGRHVTSGGRLRWSGVREGRQSRSGRQPSLRSSADSCRFTLRSTRTSRRSRSSSGTTCRSSYARCRQVRPQYFGAGPGRARGGGTNDRSQCAHRNDRAGGPTRLSIPTVVQADQATIALCQRLLGGLRSRDRVRGGSLRLGASCSPGHIGICDT